MAPPCIPFRFLKATMVNNPDPLSHEELEDLRVVEEELSNIPGLKSYILPMETLKYDIEIQPIVAPATTMRMHLTSDQYVLLCHYQAVLRVRLGYVNKADRPDFSHFKLPPKGPVKCNGRMQWQTGDLTRKKVEDSRLGAFLLHLARVRGAMLLQRTRSMQSSGDGTFHPAIETRPARG